MPSNIILKKSSVVAKVPVAGDLQFGELALNYADGKLYYKKSDGTTIDAFQAGAISSVSSVTGTAPIVSSGGTTPAISITAATTSAAGSMSAADKTKLDGIAAGAQVNVATNLAQGTRTTTSVTVTSSTGTSASLDSASTLLAGVMTAADKTKLDGVATGATANTGTVTSVGGTGTVSGLTLSGTVTTSGNLTLGGTLAVTASNFASQTANNVLIAPNGTAGVPTFRALVAADIPTLNQNTTGTASNVTGTVAVANGGTGATTAAAARTNLGATTLGGNLYTLANVAAISFPRFNADNTVSSLDAASFRTAIGAGTSSTTGTVTSVGGTGTVSGLTLTGTVTTSGNLTLGGTLAVTASNFASQTANTFLSAPNGVAGVPTFRTIVAADVPTLNQNTTGTASNVTGTVAVANGGTGATTAAAALTNLGAYPATNPSGYTSNTGTVTGVTGTAPIISSGGTAPAISISAATTSAAGSMSAADKTKLDGIATGATANTGTVTSVGGTGTVSGLTLSGTVTTSGNLTLGGTLSVTPSNFASQTANTVLAAPNGSAGTPTFRALAAADIPALTLEKLPDAWVKRAVRVATTANITLSGTQTIDGIAVVAGDRVLVKDQTTASQNGIYVVSATAWSRSLDADAATDLGAAQVAVDSGTTNGGYTFDTDFKTTDTLGTTAMNWSRVLDVAYLSTVGNSFATLTNPSAITFPRINANNTVSALDAATFRTAIGAGTSSTTGTVTSVAVSGGTTGLTTSGGPITTSGTITLAGTLAIANGGTGNTTGTATNATNVAVTTSATASAFKVPFANTTANTTGNYGLLQDSESTFTYNPSSNTLTVGTVSGALSGNATTATTASTANALNTSNAYSGTVFRSSNGITVNSATISANYTLAAGDNGMSAGPVSVNSGVVVTVSSGSRWVIV